MRGSKVLPAMVYLTWLLCLWLWWPFALLQFCPRGALCVAFAYQLFSALCCFSEALRCASALFKLSAEGARQFFAPVCHHGQRVCPRAPVRWFFRALCRSEPTAPSLSGSVASSLWTVSSLSVKSSAQELCEYFPHAFVVSFCVPVCGAWR